MRLIHSKGFTPAERNQWKVTIFQNLLQSFQTISGAMEEQEVEFEDKKNLVCDVWEDNTACCT
jgi:guanine nucleotide-binding protein subunit alpha